ncbi:MAG: hypothetical protein HWN79_11045 [Candidatus Lokiarchaeota archaeon]|nr:hypothetical protein [Candidatus Lokiarchaeota archaeon]
MSTEKKSRYRNLILLYVLYIVFWFILSAIMSVIIFPEGTPNAVIQFIPVDDVLSILVIVFLVLIPISGIIGALLGGYVLSPIIMILHKFFYGSKKFYGIQYESREQKVSLLKSGFYPVLLAVNLSFIFLTPEIISSILEADVIIELTISLRIPVFIRILSQTILLIFTFGASTVLFSPVWLLKDSGIVFTTKEKVENSNETLLIKSIGEWFQTLLKGYAGIGVIFTYIFVIYDFIILFIANLGFPGNMLNIPSLFLWLGLPFYLVFSMIPAIIVHDALRKTRLSYVRKIANRIGIRDAAFVSFELKKQDERS